MESTRVSRIESEIIDTFAQISGSLGYSEVHGKILAALMISEKVLSLEELAKKTRYSAGMISLSLDLLEVLGMVKKIKKQGDRKLYVQMSGDLVATLKTALLIKLTKGLADVKERLSDYKKNALALKGDEKVILWKNLGKLEREISRIDRYINKLAKVSIPR